MSATDPSGWQFPSWDDLAKGCEAIDGLSEFERGSARRAMAILSRELGEEFPAKAWECRHPLGMTLINQVGWTRKWLIWLAGAISASRSAAGYAGLLGRLVDPGKHREAISVLRVGDRLRRAGFTVDFDQVATVGASKRVPDLRIVDDAADEPIYVEVTSLAESRAAQNAATTSSAIQFELFRGAPFVSFAGRIHRALSDRHLAEVGSMIRQAVERARAGGGFQEVVIEGVLALGISLEADLSMLEAWSNDAQIKVGTLEGPLVTSDEVLRTRRAIEREQRQLPTERPNILVIENTLMFPWIHDMAQVVGELEEETYKYEHVFMTIVSGSYVGVDDPTGRMFRQSAYVRYCSHDVLVENHLLLPNRFCHFQLPASRVARVYSAFTGSLN